jgi:hypothetical protein
VTSISPDARGLWHAARGPVLVALLIVGVSVVIVLVRGSGGGTALDPGSVAPEGSRALARLLGTQGVRVTPAHTVADAERAAPGATVLVTRPELLPPKHLRVLADRAEDLVLIGPDQDTVDVLMPGTRVGGPTDITDRAPDCTLEQAAAPATMGGVQYESDAISCYDNTLARSEVDGVTLFGTGAPLTNGHLDEAGNAALTMRLLGQHEQLVWFVPTPGDPALRPDQRPLTELVPDGVRFGLLQVCVVVVLLALWRARRLGPVVTEPLPVVVRAAETVEGRARLYRRAGATGHAAGILRQATVTRLTHRLGLPRDAGPNEVVTAVAGHTGRQEQETHALLYGPPPSGETELVRLADALDALERTL